MTTSVFYGLPDDGYISVFVSVVVNTTGTVLYVSKAEDEYFGTFEERAYLVWDTSAIPNGDTIQSATIALYLYSYSTVAGTTTIEVRSRVWTPGGLTFLSDWSSPETGTLLATRPLDATLPPTEEYKDFSSTPAATSWVNKSGYSECVVLLDEDFMPPPSVQSSAAWYAADNAGTTKDPKLTVVHSAGSFPVSLSATLSATGGLSLRTALQASGTLGAVGLITKTKHAVLGGVFGAVGATATETIRRIGFVSTLGAIGSISIRTNRHIGGVLFSVGLLTRCTLFALSGSVYVLGDAIRRMSTLLGGAFGFASTLLPGLNVGVARALSFSGSLTRQVSYFLRSVVALSWGRTYQRSATHRRFGRMPWRR